MVLAQGLKLMCKNHVAYSSISAKEAAGFLSHQNNISIANSCGDFK
jgi:hypothetical protein